MLHLLLLALSLLAAQRTSGASDPAPLGLQEVFTTTDPNDEQRQVVLVPNVAFAGPILRDVPASSPESCAAACRELSDCAFFNYCTHSVSRGPGRGFGRCPPPPHPPTAALPACPQDGCATHANVSLPCQLLSGTCVLEPPVAARAPDIGTWAGESAAAAAARAAGGCPAGRHACPHSLAHHPAALVPTSSRPQTPHTRFPGRICCAGDSCFAPRARTRAQCPATQQHHAPNPHHGRHPRPTAPGSHVWHHVAPCSACTGMDPLSTTGTPILAPAAHPAPPQASRCASRRWATPECPASRSHPPR